MPVAAIGGLPGSLRIPASSRPPSPPGPGGRARTRAPGRVPRSQASGRRAPRSRPARAARRRARRPRAGAAASSRRRRQGRTAPPAAAARASRPRGRGRSRRPRRALGAAAARSGSFSAVKNGVCGGSAETIQAAPTQVPVPISATRSRPREAARTWSKRPTSGRHDRSKPRLSVNASALSTSGGATFLDYCCAPAPSALEPRPRRRGLARRLRRAVRRRGTLAHRAVGHAGGGRSLPGRARRRRHAEHVLHAGLRALRRRPLRDGSARRLAPALRVRLPQPRLAHADRAHARHAPGAPDLPPRAARRRRGTPSGAVHARDRG